MKRILLALAAVAAFALPAAAAVPAAASAAAPGTCSELVSVAQGQYVSADVIHNSCHWYFQAWGEWITYHFGSWVQGGGSIASGASGRPSEGGYRWKSCSTCSIHTVRTFGSIKEETPSRVFTREVVRPRPQPSPAVGQPYRPAPLTRWPGYYGPGLAGDPSYIYDNSGNPTTFPLHAHAHGSQLSTADPQQSWKFVNLQRWTNLSGQVVEVTEIQLNGTSLCADAAGGAVYLEGCRAGDGNELYWFLGDGACSSGCYWYINVAGSTASNEYEYLTAAFLGSNALVYDEGPGNGGRAEWVNLGAALRN